MRKKVVFIFSLPRSGSTLMQRILMAHKKIHSVSEPWILLPHLYSLKREGMLAEYNHSECNRAIREFIANLPDGERDYLRSLNAFFMGLYEKVCPDEAEYFLDKTPRYYLNIPMIAEVFPDAKFIFMFRNPLEILASIIETFGKGRLRIHGNRIDLYKGPKLLAQGYKLIGGKSIRVNYHDLVENPEGTVSSVLEYLGLEIDKDIVRTFHRSTLKGSMGDPGHKKFARIEKSRIGRWRNTLNTRYRRYFAKKFLKGIDRETLSVFGYDHEDLLEELYGYPVENRRLVADVYHSVLLAMHQGFDIFEMPVRKRRLKDRLKNGFRRRNR